MFHYFKTPYIICTFFLQNLSTMNILDPTFLSRVDSTIFASEHPPFPEITRIPYILDGQMHTHSRRLFYTVMRGVFVLFCFVFLLEGAYHDHNLNRDFNLPAANMAMAHQGIQRLSSLSTGFKHNPPT